MDPKMADVDDIVVVARRVEVDKTAQQVVVEVEEVEEEKVTHMLCQVVTVGEKR